MNKKIYLLPLTLQLLLTAGCAKKISSDEFKSYALSTKENVTNQSFDNVSITNKLSVNSYQYKQGEFYSYSFLGLLGIGSEREATWTEDGKYYHYHNKPFDRDSTIYEIEKEQFDSYMANHRTTIMNQLLMPIEKSLSLANGTEAEPVKSATYKKSIKQEYSIEAVQEYSIQEGESSVSVKDTYKIVFKDKLPQSYNLTTKKGSEKDSKTEWKYKYGEASFTKPSSDSQN